MDFKITEYKRSTVLTTSGRVDSYTAPELEENRAGIAGLARDPTRRSTLCAIPDLLLSMRF